MSSDRTHQRLTATETTVLVVDVQTKLLPLIGRAPDLLRDIKFLLEVAQALDVPVLATEQYPQGLGPTAPEIADLLPAGRPAKVDFSCGAVPEVALRLRELQRPTVLLVGIETAVCVLQTALDLLEQGFHVAVAVDAVAGRYDLDHDLALRRMERAGVLLTTVETTAFEWLGSSAAPQFKVVSRLVQDRYRSRHAQ
ncbi:MAG: isochorismatase family protein [Gemmataceae bacterium]